MIKKIIEEVKNLKDENHAKWVDPILQVVNGGYGETDKLLGVKTPILRSIAKKYPNLDIYEIEKLP